MGYSARAHLAYGYDLGTHENFKAAERGEYDAPNLPWFPEDDDDRDEFTEEAEKVLLASVGFTEEWTAGSDYNERKRYAEMRIGVEFDYSGHADCSGWMLIAKGSERSVEWSEAMPLDLGELSATRQANGWDAKLAAALTALGINPTQDGPRWLVYPSYG